MYPFDALGADRSAGDGRRTPLRPRASLANTLRSLRQSLSRAAGLATALTDVCEMALPLLPPALRNDIVQSHY